MYENRGDLLIGRIALREGFISREQLYDCLLAQERNPSRSLGALLVSRGYLGQTDMNRLLEIQNEALRSRAQAKSTNPRTHVLGRLLVERGLATDYQVNEALRLQGRMADAGIRPIPQLGEILVRRGALTPKAVETALQLQDLELYGCPGCGAPIPHSDGGDPEGESKCPSCNASVPSGLSRMAGSVQKALDAATRDHDLELSEEIRVAAGDPNRRFGKYVLVREIGRGGAGIVYKAWQQDSNRIVALKVLPHESDTGAGVKTPFGDVEDVKRFYTETRAHADLKHPNIVPILDFGTVDIHFYYTMIFIEGVTLDDLVREGIDERAFMDTVLDAHPNPEATGEKRETDRIAKGEGLPLSQALEIIRDVARAVDYAHRRGVYHRDIKPSNIILDGTGKPWLMDFGLAKVAHLGDSAYEKGIVMGTPYYMPPEQAIGDMEQVDAASDIYSLGAVLYELVSGHTPYGDKTPDEVLRALPQEAPEPVTYFHTTLPEQIAQIIDHAMQRDKKDRYTSAEDLAADIENALAGRPLQRKSAKNGSLAGRVRRLFGRKD